MRGGGGGEKIKRPHGRRTKGERKVDDDDFPRYGAADCGGTPKYTKERGTALTLMPIN